MTPLADGGTTVNYTNGITLTLAPGSTIMNSNKGGIWAHNSGNTASIEIDTGHPHAPDINGDLASLIVPTSTSTDIRMWFSSLQRAECKRDRASTSPSS